MTIAQRVDFAGSRVAAALGCTIPVSVALDNVLLAVCLAAWLLGGAYREKLAAFRGNPVALAAAVLFAVLAAGLAWGERNPGDGTLYLSKYIDLLLIAPLAFLLREATARAWAIRALAAALGVVLVFSCLLKAGLVPPTRWWLGTAENPVVLKQHLTHNILMAFAAFLFAELALAAVTPRGRVLLWLAALLAVVNVLFMVQGRTGYVVLGVLALYLGYRLRGPRGVSLAAGLAVMVAGVLVLVPGVFQERMRVLVGEFQEWRPGEPTQTSIGLRLEFYHNTLAIIRDAPVLGVGTGGFPRAYAEQIRGTASKASRNPHNEYLHIAAQTGLVGLAALLWLLIIQWRTAPRLAPLEHHLSRALVLTIGVGCLFNSFLLDHTEGLLYAWLTAVLYAGYNREGRTATAFFLSRKLQAALGSPHSFDDVMRLDGPPVRAKEGRRTFRLELGGCGYYFKIHTGIGWREIFKELLSLRVPTVSGLDEKRAIEAVTRLGIPTLTLAGYGERGIDPARLQSFIVTEEITGTLTLEALTAGWRRDPPGFARKQKLLEAVAGIARRLHEHGINHRDLYLCHFQLQSERLFLMDLHRAQLRRVIPRRWRVKDVAALYFSAADIGLTRRDLFRFARLYTGKPLRHTLREDRGFWRAVVTRAEKFYRREWKRAMPRVIRPAARVPARRAHARP